MKYLLAGNICNNSDQISVKKSLLLAHPNVDVTAMGIPAGWENEPLWK